MVIYLRRMILEISRGIADAREADGSKSLAKAKMNRKAEPHLSYSNFSIARAVSTSKLLSSRPQVRRSWSSSLLISMGTPQSSSLRIQEMRVNIFHLTSSLDTSRRRSCDGDIAAIDSTTYLSTIYVLPSAPLVSSRHEASTLSSPAASHQPQTPHHPQGLSSYYTASSLFLYTAAPVGLSPLL